jgi:hypothetical protein
MREAKQRTEIVEDRRVEVERGRRGGGGRM